MKIIITNRFRKQYFKAFEKSVSLVDFTRLILQKYHKNIPLPFPYFKVKQNINGLTFRGVIFLLQEESSIIPLILFLKKDKKYWENIAWKTHKNLIIEEHEKALVDIEKGDFKIF